MTQEDRIERLISAGVGLEAGLDPAKVGERAAAATLGGLRGAPDVALVFASAAWGPGAREALTSAADAVGAKQVVGATCAGLLAPGRELIDNPATGILSLWGVSARSLLLDDLAGREQNGADDLAEWLARARGPELVVLLLDGLAVDPEPLLAAATGSLEARSRLVGAGLRGGPGGGATLLYAGEALPNAGVAIALAGAARVGSSGPGPLRGPRYEVTDVRGHWLRAIDARPPLEVLREALGVPFAEVGSEGVLVAQAPGEEGSGAAPRLREIVGVDEQSGALALAGAPAPGSAIMFALRDSALATTELAARVRGLSGAGAAFLLQLGCATRSRGLLGPPGAESGVIAGALRSSAIPFIGVQGGYQIGPSASRDPDLLTHSSVVCSLANMIA